MPLPIGSLLPSIRCETQSGLLDLDAYRDAKILVVWAYPKDDTAG